MIGAHHAALTAKKDETMQSHGDRIGWVEADLQRLMARVEAHEQRADTERRLTRGEQEAFKRDEERERDRLRSEFAYLENRLAEYGVANERDKYEGAQMLGDRIAWQSNALAVLALVSLFEAVAIALLWWSR